MNNEEKTKQPFHPISCDHCYVTRTVTVQFEGILNTPEALKYIERYYPAFKGDEVVDFREHTFYKGLENIGYVTYKHFK